MPITNNWSCLPKAFAMASGIPVEVIIEEIGHDGSEILFPQYKEPYCRRGFHIQELINVMDDHGILVTPFETELQLIGGTKPNYTIKKVKLIDPEYMRRKMFNSVGVLVGDTNKGNRHAIIWRTGLMYDNDGSVVDCFQIKCFYRLR